MAAALVVIGWVGFGVHLAPVAIDAMALTAVVGAATMSARRRIAMLSPTVSGLARSGVLIDANGSRYSS
ncbi:MAG TPA: hypothetical protein VNN74_00105 [Candidatus Micrarchaeia archaeon]|nr:hypothetical protein [Candidatus Micrarchaeia archaeon]